MKHNLSQIETVEMMKSFRRWARARAVLIEISIPLVVLLPVTMKRQIFKG